MAPMARGYTYLREDGRAHGPDGHTHSIPGTIGSRDPSEMVSETMDPGGQPQPQWRTMSLDGSGQPRPMAPSSILGG